MRTAGKRWRQRGLAAAAGVALTVAAAGLAAAQPGPARAATQPRVLLVGSWHGISGGYRTIRAAVTAAQPGDWILVGPCQGGVYLIPPGTPGQAPLCYFQALGNQVLDNSFARNGGFGNPTNGDVALFTTPSVDLAAPHHLYGADCFAGNTDAGGLSSDPPAVQSDPLYACGTPSPGSPDPALLVQAECAAQLFAGCPALPGLSYPRPAASFPLPRPAAQPSMPNPCAGVPPDPWCPAGG